jgi:hypothetical protein
VAIKDLVLLEGAFMLMRMSSGACFHPSARDHDTDDRR